LGADWALAELSNKINYKFKNLNLLTQALTHCSCELGPDENHNERLEFLGDSILGLVISEWLFNYFPTYSEGELTRMKASLVKGETLSELAKNLKLGESLRLGVGELKAGGRYRASNLENVFEALIGAIFLDTELDFKKTQSLVILIYQQNLKNLSELLEKAREDKNKIPMAQDAKTALQEYLQKLGEPLPIYEINKIEGPEHAQLFTVQCAVMNADFFTLGQGRTRKSAEQDAAKQMLEKIKK